MSSKKYHFSQYAPLNKNNYINIINIVNFFIIIKKYYTSNFVIKKYLKCFLNKIIEHNDSTKYN